MGLVQHFSFLQAYGKTEVLGCFRESVDDMLQTLLRVNEKGTVVSKQQPNDEFLRGFCACEEPPKVKYSPVCAETDVDA